MLLAGNFVTGDQAERNELIGRIFSIVPQFLRNHQKRSRFVGFSSTTTGLLPIHVFGMEVESAPPQLPDDIRAILIGDKEIRLVDTENRATDADWLRRQWRSEATATMGDFTAAVRSHLWPDKAKGNHLFLMTASAPYDLRVSGYQDEVTIEPYDPVWNTRFAAMREWLTSTLGTDCARRIEHNGSTAIAGMAAKPIVDVLVEIPSF